MSSTRPHLPTSAVPRASTQAATAAVLPPETDRTPPASSPPASVKRESHPPTQIALGLNDGDRRVLRVLVVAALLLMLVHWYRLTQYRPQPIEVLHPEGYVFQLDVNSATWVEWMQLDNVGETLARRIVEDRRLHGPFTSVEDVQRVPGIGPKTMESLRPHLTCAHPPETPADGPDPDRL